MFDNLADEPGNGTSPKPAGIYPPSGAQNRFQAQSMDAIKRPGPIPNAPISGGASPVGGASFRPETAMAEDIFSGSDRQEKPAVFQARQSAAIPDRFGMSDASYPGQSLPSPEGDKGKMIVLVLMVVSLLLVFFAAWYAYRLFFSASIPGAEQIIDEVPTSREQAPVKTETQAQVEAKNESLPLVADNKEKAKEVADSDGDGLDDDEEYRAGTDINEADSDGDGLFDREEVKVYKTDPLNTDSDKDGYTDGIEVKGGFNPNGAGKLYKQ